MRGEGKEGKRRDWMGNEERGGKGTPNSDPSVDLRNILLWKGREKKERKGTGWETKRGEGR